MNDLNNVMKLAIMAGKIILGASDIGSRQTEKSGDFNLVTEYDVKVQTFLFGELRKLYPDAKFIGEEVGTDSPVPLEKGFSFIIDPIDGTTNFIHGYGITSVSIAMLLDGEDYIGVVYNPFTNEMFSAKKGECAFFNGKRILVGSSGLEENLLGFGTSPYYRHIPYYNDGTFSLLRQLYPHCQDLRRAGSAALDICYVASGRQGLFFELILQPYDYAAAALILREAGGIITQIDGTPISYEEPVSILAGNNECHRDFFRFTSPIDKA